LRKCSLPMISSPAPTISAAPRNTSRRGTSPQMAKPRRRGVHCVA
jgi:hypothetical protein